MNERLRSFLNQRINNELLSLQTYKSNDRTKQKRKIEGDVLEIEGDTHTITPLQEIPPTPTPQPSSIPPSNSVFTTTRPLTAAFPTCSRIESSIIRSEVSSVPCEREGSSATTICATQNTRDFVTKSTANESLLVSNEGCEGEIALLNSDNTAVPSTCTSLPSSEREALKLRVLDLVSKFTMDAQVHVSTSSTCTKFAKTSYRKEEDGDNYKGGDNNSDNCSDDNNGDYESWCNNSGVRYGGGDNNDEEILLLDET